MKLVIGGKEFEVSDEVVTKSIEENKPVSIDATGLTLRSEEEEASFVTNIKAESKKAGEEIAVKAVREKLGLTFTGKTVENLAKAVEEKTLADAKIEPEKKVQELTNDVKTLQGTIASLTAEKDSIVKEHNNYKAENIIKGEIIGSLPDNLIVPKDDMVLLIRNRMNIGMDETFTRAIGYGADGNPIKNPTTAAPLAVKDLVTGFLNENPTYLKGASGGAGGGDSDPGGGKKVTVETFLAEKAKEGKSHTDPEVIAELEKLDKDGLLA